MALPAILLALGRVASTAIARSAAGRAVAGAGSAAGRAGRAYASASRLGQKIQSGQQRLQYMTPGSIPHSKLSGQIQKWQEKQAGAYERVVTGAGKAAESLGKLSPVIGRVVGIFNQWMGKGAALIEEQRRHAAYSGTHAVAVSQLNVARFMRNVELARGTSNTFKSMTNSQIDLEKSTLKYSQAWTNASNMMATGFNRVVSGILNFADKNPLAVSILSPALGAINASTELINWLAGKGPSQTQPLADITNFLASSGMQRRRRPPLGQPLIQPPVQVNNRAGLPRP